MKDETIVARFIELRAQGWTFARIAAELNVNRTTLIDWGRKYQFQIQNLRVIEQESAAEALQLSREQRVQALGRDLRRIEEELAKRDFSQIPTARLLQLALRLRRQAQQEYVQPQFTTPLHDIPSNEQIHKVIDWTV